MGLPVLLHEWLGLTPQVSVALALVAAFFFNFFTVRNVVFRASGPHSAQLLRFGLATLIFRAGEYLGFLLLYAVLKPYYTLALGVVLIVSISLKFITYRQLVFAS
jgi:putative flippase GtrA